MARNNNIAAGGKRRQTSMTCYKCEVSVKVIFDKNGLLYIFVGETEGFCYFQEANGE